MNRTQNSLSRLSQLPQKSNDIIRTLRIQTYHQSHTQGDIPEDGSSRNRSNSGFAANSTPIVTLFLSATLNPTTVFPIIASAIPSISNSAMTCSTYSSFSSFDT